MKSSNKRAKKIAQTRPKKTIILKHINGIKRALLDGEKRPVFLEFLRQSNHKNGLYALYKGGKLYYIGKATDLKRRLDNHLRDKHWNSWDEMTLFFLSSRANVAELEGLLVATAKPPGNTQNPRIGSDLKKELKKYLTEDAKSQIDSAIYPNKPIKGNALSKHITNNHLRALSRSSLARSLKISLGKLNKLWEEDSSNLRVLRRYIRESDNRNAVLLLIDKLKN